MVPIRKTAPVAPPKGGAEERRPTAEHLLHLLSLDASDALGWTVSRSAMLRALLAYVGQQSPMWTAATIFPLIERESEQETQETS
jgi:hypothetical protein